MKIIGLQCGNIRGGLGYDDARALLNAELAAGEGPDLMDVTGFYQSDLLAQKGAFVDLNVFFSGDLGLEREDYLKSVLELYTLNDAMYAVMTSFTFNTLIAHTSLVGDRETLSVHDIADILESEPTCNEAFPDKPTMLGYGLYYDIASYMDYDRAACFFDSEQFKELLQVANSGSVNNGYYLFNSNTDHFMSGYTLLDQMNIYDITQLQRMKALVPGGVSIIGYPSYNGRRLCASPYGGALAICSSSPYQEIAWEFIALTLSEEYQKGLEYCFPVRLSALEAQMAKAQEREPMTITYGEYQEVKVEVLPATDAEIDELWTLLNGINCKFSYHYEFYPIIFEEANLYFEGKVSIDEACDAIQNRASLYLSEHY